MNIDSTVATTIAVAGVLGACAGSFLGVVVHRLPRGMSIVHPSSRCGACGTRLSWFENVPILSWLMLRGRCRHCGTGIPASCLVMEVAVATISALVVWGTLTSSGLWCQPLLRAGFIAEAFGIATAVLLLLTWLLIAAVLIDWEHLILPDELTKGLQTVAVPLAVCTGSNFMWPWDPSDWFRHFDVLRGWQGTSGTAAWFFSIYVLAGLGLLLASLPVARRIYGKLQREPWDERDHRAMAIGAKWYVGWLLGWSLVTISVTVLVPNSYHAADGHPGSLLCIGLTQAVLGSLVGWWLPWLVGLGGTVFFRRNAMGYGDVKLFAALGAFLGPIGTIVAFMFACIVGTIIGVPARLMGAGREMPFGPSLAVGAVLTIVLGPWLAPLLQQRWQSLL